MGLAAFIRSNEHNIVAEWSAFARAYIPAAEKMDSGAVRNHSREILHFIARDLETPQTELERSQKAKGLGPRADGEDGGAAGSHGELRYLAGFDIVQVHAEFRALRASVLKLWTAAWVESNREWMTPPDIISDLMRFNEAIDQIVSESLARFLEKQGTPGQKGEKAGKSFTH
jgi:hypothetical protein